MRLPGPGDRQGSAECLGRQLAMRSRYQRQSRTTAEEAGGVDFGDTDMRLLAAIDGAPGRADGGESQRIGGSAGGDGKDAHRRLEDLAVAVLQQRGPLVAAIAGRRSLVRCGERGDDLGRGTAGIVAAKVDDLLVRAEWCGHLESRSLSADDPSGNELPRQRSCRPSDELTKSCRPVLHVKKSPAKHLERRGRRWLRDFSSTNRYGRWSGVGPTAPN